MESGHVYILGSATGTLYVGVTSDIRDRMRQHKNGAFDGFAKRYGCNRLLYAESFDSIIEAITREKQLKGWRREKKLALIQKLNPEFMDLADKWLWPRLGPCEPLPKSSSS